MSKSTDVNVFEMRPESVASFRKFCLQACGTQLVRQAKLPRSSYTMRVLMLDVFTLVSISCWTAVAKYTAVRGEGTCQLAPCQGEGGPFRRAIDAQFNCNHAYSLAPSRSWQRRRRLASKPQTFLAFDSWEGNK